MSDQTDKPDNDENLPHDAVQIRTARERLEWSQTELARRAGTSQQVVDRIERGLTMHSRATPKIKFVLGLGGSPTSASQQRETPALHSGDPDDYGLAAYEIETGARAEPTIPVFSFMWYSDKERLSIGPVDLMPKTHPVRHVQGVFAVISTDAEMAPAVRPGDVVVINPHLQPTPECEVFLTRVEGGRFFGLIRTLVEQTDEEWVVKTWSPSHVARLPKEIWPKAEMIVSKIIRSA